MKIQKRLTSHIRLHCYELCSQTSSAASPVGYASINSSGTDKAATMVTTYGSRLCWCPSASILAYRGAIGKRTIARPSGVIAGEKTPSQQKYISNIAFSNAVLLASKNPRTVHCIILSHTKLSTDYKATCIFYLYSTCATYMQLYFYF